MKVSEINQLTLNEIQQLTPRDLESDISEILKRYENSKLPLTPNMVNKLNELAGLLPECERRKFFSVKTIGEAVVLINGLFEIGKNITQNDVIMTAISEFANAISSLF